MEKYLALDIGNKRIGVAVSDPFNEYALPCETYWRKNLKTDIQYFAELIEKKYATAVVCGLPVFADGTESEQTVRTKRFIEELEKACVGKNVKIITQDERYTTLEAENKLIANNVRREERKNCIDSVAAAEILNGYLMKIKKENR